MYKNYRKYDRHEEMIKALFLECASYTNELSAARRRLHFFRKKYAWLAVLSSTSLVKRLIDVIVSGTMLVMLSPLFLIVAATIKLIDNGPVLYWQMRVGQRGREFSLPKFRSMVVGADNLKETLLDNNHHRDSITFKMKRDPRITWIGRIIRKTSIDEMPQLWNVFKGEMSLVGPRPPLPEEVERYSVYDRQRLEVLPGLTSPWAISGRGNIPFTDQVKLDIQYIKSHSLWLDILILLKTIPAILLGKGAY